MSTASQIAANKANAQKSSGPKTEAGKATSSRNHLSHGFTSSATIIPGEDPEEFKALLDDLILHHQPDNPTEQILVEQMAINQWLILRAFRLQGYAFFGQALRTDDKFATPKDLALLIRYQTSAERGFHRSHSELVKTQKERKKSEIGFEPKNSGERVQPTDPAPTQPKTEPKSPPQTSVQADSPAEPAASNTPADPDVPEFRKTAA